MENTQVATVKTGALLPGMKVKRVITVPTLVMKKEGEGRFLKFNEAMHISKVPGKIGADGKQEKPATVALVTDVESGEQLNYMIPAVVIANLNEEYKKDSYVGLTFAIQNVGKREGKRYVDFKIAEVEYTAPK